MINERENGYLTVALLERGFGTESTSEHILPDYQSEIRRMLCVKGTVLPPAKYVSSDSVEFNGTVDYQVLYVGGDGGVYSIPLSSEYSFSVPYEIGECETDGVSVLCSVALESVSTRVSGPRKLSIRSRLRPNVRIYGKLPICTQMIGEVEPASVYTREASVMCVECESAVSDIVSLNYASPLASEDTRVVSADARVVISSREMSAGALACRGKVLLKLMCCAEESGELSLIERELPFDCDIETSLLGDDVQSKVRGVLSEMSVNVGEEGVECNMGIMLDATLCRNVPVTYTADVYSTDRECESRTKTTTQRRAVMCGNANLTFSERVPLDSICIPEGAEIVDALGSVCFDKCEPSESRLVFSGNAGFVFIYRNEGELYSCDVSIPVRYEAQAESGELPSCFEGCAEAVDIRARAEQGELRVDAELMISVDCMGESVVELVESATFGEKLTGGSAELIVCYPSSDDTLWSVAKRYKVAPDSVIGAPESDRYVMIG